MIEKLESTKKQLSELATVLNAFKSEAVQLRILDFLLDGQLPASAPQKPRKTGKRHSAPKMGNGKKSTPHKKTVSGSGPVATLSQLLSTSFFDKPRTINDIIEHCKHNMARTFKASDISGKLGRLVRSNELTRKKNTDNQYEYKKS